jgi:hypothetical protein
MQKALTHGLVFRSTSICLMKKTRGRKSDDTVPLNTTGINCDNMNVMNQHIVPYRYITAGLWVRIRIAVAIRCSGSRSSAFLPPQSVFKFIIVFISNFRMYDIPL